MHTTESSDDMCSSRETTSSPRNVLTTAGCSETTAIVSTALASTFDASIEDMLRHGLSQNAGSIENMHTEHSVTMTKKGGIQFCYAGSKSSTYDDEVPTESQLTDSALHVGSILSPPAAYRKTSIEMPHVANTLSLPVADRKTSVVKEGGHEAIASTSPSSVTVATCSKNQRNKVWYKYVRRCGRRQNCQPTKILPRKRQNEQHKYRQYNSMIQQMYDKMKEISTSCESSAALEMIQRLLRQNWIEKFWQQWILQQMGIQISQSEDNVTALLSHALRQNSKVSKTTYTQEAYTRVPRPGNTKSTRLSTESARSQSSSLPSALGLAGHYKKPQCQLFSFIQSENVKESTSTRVSARTTSTSTRSSVSSSFQSSATTNSSFQNYKHRLPAVCIATTKQTARKSCDDRQEEDRRGDESNSPPRRGPRRSPLPIQYVCVFCRKVNYQRTNHRRHLVMRHHCRIDGTPATAADIAQAKKWSSSQPTGRSARYKTQEFVGSDSDDDTTQASCASTPSRHGSPAPSESRGPKRTRIESSESASPRRNTSPRRGGSQRPATSTSAASRPATPPRSAPPAQKQACKVRFEQEKAAERQGESSAKTKTKEKKSVKPSSETAKEITAATKKGQKTKADKCPTAEKAETEIQQTPVATTSAKEIRMTSSKLDALAAVAKQAVQNLKKRETCIKIKEPPAKPKRVIEPSVKRHQHPLPTKGRSAYTGKGKATAPAKKPPEIIKVSVQDVLGTLLPVQEPRVTSSPRPTATIVPKPVSTTAEATATETIRIEDESDKEGKVRELLPTTNVEQDLELSQDTDEEAILGVCIIDVEGEQPVFDFPDVEPDYTPKELAARQQQMTSSATTTAQLIPEILMKFQDTMVISDDASEPAPTTTPSKKRATTTSSMDVAASAAPANVAAPATSTVVATTPGFILVTEPYRPASPPIMTSTINSATARTPIVRSTVVAVSTGTTPTATITTDVSTTSTATAPRPSIDSTTATPSKSLASGQRPSSTATTVDIPDRKPCRPEKPYNAVCKIKTMVPEPAPIPRPPEVTPPVRRHRKLIDHMKLANATLNYNISTDEISRGFALSYSLNEGEWYALRNDLRKMRLAQKAMMLKIRAKFPVNCATEDRRQDYLNYFEDESLRIASRHLDSNDDFDIGPRI